MFVDAKAGNAAPSKLAMAFSLFGSATETLGPWLWLCGGATAQLGVVLIAGSAHAPLGPAPAPWQEHHCARFSSVR